MPLTTKKLLAQAIVLSAAISPCAHAACTAPSGNFTLSANVNNGNTCYDFSSSKANDFFNALGGSSLNALTHGAYTGSEAATIVSNFNSLNIKLSFPGQLGGPVGTRLQMDIDALNQHLFWDGVTREDSKQAMIDYIKRTDLIGRIMKYQAENSASSPITGPGGTIPTAAAGDFNQNFNEVATKIAAPASVANAANQSGVVQNLFGAALSAMSVTSHGNKIKATTIPLSYTIRNDLDPRRQLVLTLPITEIDTNGAKSYQGALGVAYRMPMNDNWTLTPSGKLSGLVSKDMATAAGLYSISITSTYIWNMDSYDIAMGNMVSYNQTMKISSGDYSIDPGIKSTVFRNGLMLSQPITIAEKKMSIEYSLIDTRNIGTKYYVSDTQEIGVTLGTNKNAFSSRSFFRGGLTFLHGKDTKGITANFGYWF